MWNAVHPIEFSPYLGRPALASGHGIYDKRRFYDGTYKTAKEVIQTLVDVVSKNGNLLLSIPVRADGTIDSLEYQVVREIGAWLNVNGESIYGTRPWYQFGEGPSAEAVNPIAEQGFNEGKVKYTSADIRYVTKGKTIYATTLDVPQAGSTVKLKALLKAHRVTLLGYGKVAFKSSKQGLSITLPQALPNRIALVMKIE